MNTLNKDRINFMYYSGNTTCLYLTLGLTFWRSTNNCDKPFIYNYTCGDFISCSENEGEIKGSYTAASSLQQCNSESRIDTINNVIDRYKSKKTLFVAIHIIYSDEARFYCSDLFSERHYTLFKVGTDKSLKFIEGEPNVLDIIPELEYQIPYVPGYEQIAFEKTSDNIWCDSECPCGYLKGVRD